MVPGFIDEYNLPDEKVPLKDVIFDRSTFLKDEKYKTILDPSENHDN